MLGKVIALGLGLAFGAVVPASAQAFKTGENTRGSVKDCYYEYLGQAYVLTVGAYQMCPLTARVPQSSYYAPPSYGGIAYKTGERRVGQVKECYYAYAGRSYLLTVGAYEMCPLTATVP